MVTKSTLGFITFAFVVCTTFVITSGLDCSNVVRKESQGVLNWLGNVTFEVPVTTTNATGWTVTIFFDQQFTGVGVWDGWVESFGSEQWCRIRNRDHNAELIKGDEFSFRFRVNWFTNVTDVPKVVSLKFFDIELCQ